MSKTSRRARCESTANEVDIPRPFDLDELCARIAARRNRPLRLVPLEGVPDAATPCGVWVATTTSDLIFYEPATSPVHKLQIVLHELAHLLLGHGATDRERPSYVSRLLQRSRAADPVRGGLAPYAAPAKAPRPSTDTGSPDGAVPRTDLAHPARAAHPTDPPTAGGTVGSTGLGAELGDELDADDELDLDQLLHVLGRTSYTDEEERDAELLATLLSDRVLRPDAATRAADGGPDGHAGVLDRLNDAFGHPLRG
ncbi:hypothetical protein MTQ01_05990 [Streptomyces sp. XM4193]|uniref:hypothetical protein n=1 Tax=Streptomyces sp. XM4193 TaxID=2929782 RepID=UPI001FF7DD41|nr:hypothetical protein [Streptomyces sp. XM4193]MCK1795565.1 hypothetical protein [Streptomyces sp. XM4193]